jgi:hypothetical protein
MGELLPATQVFESRESPVVGALPLVQPDNQAAIGVVISDLCSTSPSDWKFAAEGGANIVFKYHGSNSVYYGRVLRVPKFQLASLVKPDNGSHHFTSSPLRAAKADLQTVWREEILPRLVPPELLLDVHEQVLDAQWADEVLRLSESLRPETRKDVAVLDVSKETNGTVKGILMEDMAGQGMEGETVLSVEIKVCWP